jgi:3-methyladenine DNA glycosylase Tag
MTTAASTRLVIADDHPLFRNALRQAVATVVASAKIDEAGSFDAYLAGRVPPPPTRLPTTARAGEIPATTPASDALSLDLKKRGFRFVGSTIVYAFMQSVGLVDDHLPGCFRYRG